MKDIECPYCNYDFNDDDWGENNAGTWYEKECPNCEKIMILSFSVFPFFTSKKISGE